MLCAYSEDVRTLKEMQVDEKVMRAMSNGDTGHIHRAYGTSHWHFRKSDIQERRCITQQNPELKREGHAWQ